MTSEQYRPTNKTVVTELKTFVVDAVRKVQALRTTVASAANLDTPIKSLDINVGDSGYLIEDISTLIAITSVKPFDLELTQIHEIVTPVEQHFTGVVEVSDVALNSLLHIKVTDLDLVSPTIVCYVDNDITGESEIVTLSRVGTTHTYVGSILIAEGTVGTDNDGQMNAEVSQTLTVSYNDQANDDNEPEIIDVIINVLPVSTHTGIVQLDKLFVLGSSLLVRVYDPDVSTSVEVTVSNETTGEFETLTLLEVSPGLFEQVIPTLDSLFGVSNDGVLYAQDTHVLTATYLDAVDSTGVPAIITDSIVVNAPVYHTGQLNVDTTLKAGQPIIIELEDKDRSSNVQVTVTNETTNELETLTLLETHPLSGVFRAQLLTNLGIDIWYAGTNDDGQMNVKPNDVLTVRYNDPISASGMSLAVTETVSIIEPDPIPDPPPPIVTYETHRLNMTVNGLFYVNGNLPNTTIMLRKTELESDEYIRCSLMVV